MLTLTPQPFTETSRGSVFWKVLASLSRNLWHGTGAAISIVKRLASRFTSSLLRWSPHRHQTPPAPLALSAPCAPNIHVYFRR